MNKNIVITGAGGVLCSEFARVLAQDGGNIIMLDKNPSGIAVLERELTQAGLSAAAIQADVLDKSSLMRAREIMLNKFGPCDILINGAGGNNPKGTTSKEYLMPEDLVKKAEGVTTFFDLDPAGVGFVFNLNFLGTLLTTQVFAREMAEKSAGSIINISSMNAFTPLTKIPAYSGAKAAISNFTQWLAVHFSKVNIRVNAIAPGFFLTEQNRTLLTNPDGSLTARGNTILSHTPMGRFGTPDDLTGALLFLIDDSASSFINGVVLPVDGAFSAFSGV